MENGKDLSPIADFLFEVGILAKTPRSGFHFLGTGDQSVAEHLNRVTFIGYVLASIAEDPKIDMAKVLKMCFLHDIAESRMSDLNYVHQKYVTSHEEKVLDDLAATLPFGNDVRKTVEERNEGKTREAMIAKDADQLEWILSLKEQFDNGNSKAKDWQIPALKRLKTEVARLLAQKILEGHVDNWWFANKEDKWWIHRDKKE